MTAGPLDPIIVLLEDDGRDAELIEARLRSEGITLAVERVAAESAYLAVLEARPVALVLSDFSLPGYDGLSALAAARRLVPAAPFLFVSGAIGEERALETMRRGATDYVLKDRLDRLGPAVRRALDEAETRRQRARAEQERDQLLLSERQAREAAEQANRLKDEFLAVVSHELRTPLNAILGWAALLASGRADEDKQRRGLEAILRNGRMQARLIEDILDVSRIVSGKLGLHRAQVTVDSFVQGAVDSVRPMASTKGVALSVDVAAEAGEVFGDGERLQQVVWNLLSNAVKFTPAGGSVHVSAVRRGGQVVLEVIDTGMGIDPAFLPHVFEPFRQGDATKTRVHRGLGLGLAIVRHLVEMHGGRVDVASDGPGRGATFRVQVPVRPTVDPSGAARDLRGEGAGAGWGARGGDADVSIGGRLTGLRVLVLDDEPEARDVLVELLGTSGAAVFAFGAAAEALEALEAVTPDVVVSDIGMPGTDGYSFIRHVRARGRARGGEVPAIALTAYARDLDRAEATRAGFQCHLPKPVTPETLVDAIAALAPRRGEGRGGDAPGGLGAALPDLRDPR
jgi:signal transduction histidine kinase